jgi:hypothetical protein
MNQGISRRDFLWGSAVAAGASALGLGGASLLAAAPKAPSAPVSIARCKNYDLKDVLGQMRAMMDQLGGLRKLVAGKTVCVKVNLTGNPRQKALDLPASRTYHTHPHVALAAAKGRRRSQFCGKWTTPYIALILRDRRAVGEFQPRLADETPDGAPIPGYYPAVVGETEYALARQALDGRKPEIKRRHRKHINVFNGLLTHARDGGGMMLRARKGKDGTHLTLWNTSNHGGGAEGYSWPYFDFEEMVLGRMVEIPASDILPSAKPARRVDELRARLDHVRKQIAELGKDLAEGYSKTVAAVLKQREAEEIVVGDELQRELAESVAPAARAWESLPSLVDVFRESPDPDATRMRIRAVLQRAVDTMPVLFVRRGAWRLAAVQVFFKGGAVRHYLLAYLPEAHARPRRVECRSFAEAGIATGLDLRDPSHAARLAAALEAADF